MNIQTLPPEITSMQMFGGTGPGPLFAAAAGWDGLAAELDSAAASFESLTSGLAGGAWQGAASAAMTASAAPYVGWLSAASAHADTAAGLARAAASAFEAAQAATVYPAVIAANRNQLVALVNSNLLGLNTPAIFAAEADYEMMWAQDIAAMVGYHGESSAIVAALTPIVQPLANLANLPAQAAAAVSTPTATGPQPAAVSIPLPRITIPPFNIPNFQLPALNLLDLSIGNFSTPEIDIPQISMSSFSLPPLHISLSTQSLTIPSFTFPAFSLPAITLGGFSTPQLATSPLVLPSLHVPESGFWIPFGGSNVPGNMGLLTSHSPNSSYVSVVLNGVPDVEINPVPVIGNIKLGLPSTIYINFALQVQGPTSTPGIYLGDFNMNSGQFTGNTGFVLPPIDITGFTIPSISIPSWQTPAITLTNPGVTIDIGSIGVSGAAFGPVVVPPISVGAFQIPNIAVDPIDVGAFNTPGPIAHTGSLDVSLLGLIPRIGIDWQNPFSGLINPGPNGPTLGPITTPAITATVDIPQITFPPLSIPPFNLNAISVPPINLAPFNLGQIGVPGIQVNGVNIGAINIPTIDIGLQLPNIAVGTFTTPAITVGSAGGFSLPTIKIPQISLPEISLYNPDNPKVTFGLDITSYAFIDLTGSIIHINHGLPFSTEVSIGVPATQIPPLTLVNATDVGNQYSLVIDGTIQALTLPQVTIDQFSLGLPTGPQLNLSDIDVGNIALGSFNLPQITVPPISVGPLTGFTLPGIGLGGIQIGATTGAPVTIPPISLTETILPSFTLLPAIPL